MNAFRNNIVIFGGGPAGLSPALALGKLSPRSVVLTSTGAKGALDARR